MKPAEDLGGVSVELLRDYRMGRGRVLPALFFWLVWALLRGWLEPGRGQQMVGVAAQFWLAYSTAWWALTGLASGGRGRHAVEIIGATLLAASLGALLAAPLTAGFSWRRPLDPAALLFQLAPAVGLALVLHLLPLAARWRERRKHVAEAARLRQAAAVADLSRQVTLAELNALQAQIEPHFLYNTLAGIQYLVRHNPPLADRMLGRLHDYLRLALPAMREPMSTLAREFALADAYLALMKMRLGVRLRVQLQLPPALAGQAIPPLMLGSLIENAIQHGIEPKPQGGEICIEARLAGDGVNLSVIDSGVGLQAAAAGQTAGSGMGLSCLQERLRLLFGEAARLVVGANAQGGVTAAIWLPWSGAERVQHA